LSPDYDDFWDLRNSTGLEAGLRGHFTTHPSQLRFRLIPENKLQTNCSTTKPNMKKPIISVSGLRGIIGETLAPPIAMQYVAAFASSLEPGPIVVTRDGRATGQMLAAGIGSALMAIGRQVHFGDVAATPTTGILVRECQAAGGVQISASHNPPEYNGLKFFGADGRVIGADAGQKVIDTMESPTPWVTHDKIASQIDIDDTISRHLQLVLEAVDVQKIRSKNFSVVLDSNHGAGSILAKSLFEKLNCRSVLVGDTPNGHFAHPPEPTAENLKGIAALASKHQADVVFCQDPDADRLAIIDGQGRYIGEEYTLALTLKGRLTQQKGDCVINCATSRMSIDIAEQFGCKCHLSAVGEANVCDLMQSVGAVYGGEGNGGPIDPRVGFVRDSFVAMSQVLDLMAESGKSIAELVSEIPAYSIHKAKSSVSREKLPDIYDALKKRFSQASSSDQDGLRFDWDDRWLLIRPSNTEPIVRIICETNDHATSELLAAETAQVIDSI